MWTRAFGLQRSCRCWSSVSLSRGGSIHIHPTTKSFVSLPARQPQYDNHHNPLRQRHFSSGRLLTIYKSMISSSSSNGDVGGVQEDPHQIKALQELDRLRDELLEFEPHEPQIPKEEEEEQQPQQPISPPPTVSSYSSWRSFFQSDNNTTSDDVSTTITTTPSKRKTPQGVYLHGGVGCGKTFCMNIFFDSLTLQNSPYWYQEKQHVHFHKFMLNVHQHIHELKMVSKVVEGDPLPQVVDRILSQGKLLCFDEFQVTDIADAMILKRLCTLLWEQGGIIVATSNRPPSDLYLNGIQRDLFLPFLQNILPHHCHVVSMEDSPVDYRLVQAAQTTSDNQNEHTKVFWTGESNHPAFLRLFAQLTPPHAAVVPTTLTTPQGRRHVFIPQCVMEQGIAKFSYEDLCQKALGAADYLVMGQHFHTILVDRIPTLTRHEINWVRRFIVFVDTMYECHVKLILHTLDASTPQDLFVVEDDVEEGGGGGSSPKNKYPNIDEVFAFDRTQSRLEEMASTTYLQQRWRGNQTKTNHPPQPSKKEEKDTLTLTLPQPSVSEDPPR